MIKPLFASILVLCVIGFLLSSAEAADYDILEKIDTITVQSNSYAVERHALKVRINTEEGTNYREAEAVNGYIQIKNVTGSVTFPGGRNVPIKNEDIFEVPIAESADTMTDYKAVVIQPPNLEKGSIVQIQYDRYVKSLLYLDSWVYATSVPIGKANCTITYPSQVGMKFRGHDQTVRVQKTESAGKITITFDASNAQPIRLHGDSEHFGNVQKKVTFLCEQCGIEKWTLSTSTWGKIAEWFSELSRYAYNSDATVDAVVNDVISKHRAPADVADALYQYIQKNFAYTAVEVGIGGYKPRFALQTFQKKYGDCKDLTMLYLTMLRKAGIEGYPALVDTRSSKFFYQDFPSPSQFNHCIAYLPKIKNGIFVDSTVKNFRLGELPVSIQGKYALISGGPNTMLKIPENFAESNLVRFRATGNIVGTELKLAGKIEAQGMQSGMMEFLQNALTRNLVKHYVHRTFLMPGLPIRKVETAYAGDRTMTLNFSTFLRSLSSYDLLLVNVVHYGALDSLLVNPKPNDYFALGAPIRLVLDAEVDLGERRLASKTINTTFKGNFTKYVIEVREDAGKLRYFADVFFNNGFLDDREMKEYQSELKQFASLLQRNVLLRR